MALHQPAARVEGRRRQCSGPPSLHCRREVQQYIPAQLFHSTAGATWLSLVSQHRQQTQALSPHQARAQFLGKSAGWGRSSWGLC